jgi:hypothetical protein
MMTSYHVTVNFSGVFFGSSILKFPIYKKGFCHNQDVAKSQLAGSQGGFFGCQASGEAKQQAFFDSCDVQRTRDAMFAWTQLHT